MKKILVKGEMCRVDSDSEAYRAAYLNSVYGRVAVLDPRLDSMVKACSPVVSVIYSDCTIDSEGLLACVNEEVLDGEIRRKVNFFFHELDLGGCLPNPFYIDMSKEDVEDYDADDITGEIEYEDDEEFEDEDDDEEEDE